MSTPRDRDGFDDEAGRAWQEPAHLGGEEPAQDEPNIADRRRTPRDSDPSVDPATWQPAGWDLPAAEPERPAQVYPPPQGPAQAGPPVPDPSRARRRGAVDDVFGYEGDVAGAQGWALDHGWTLSDGSAPEDAVLQQLIASAPVRMTKDHRPGSVLRGRAGTLELVAFDGVYTSGRYVVPEYAITAAPLLGTPPVLRLSPARLWKHGVGGMVHIPSDNPDFDRRWQLLAAEDGPQVRRLVADADVQRLLLGTDDGDEFWTAAGYLAAVRPDGHRPELLEHHARLLSALVGALALGY